MNYEETFNKQPSGLLRLIYLLNALSRDCHFEFPAFPLNTEPGLVPAFSLTQ